MGVKYNTPGGEHVLRQRPTKRGRVVIKRYDPPTVKSDYVPPPVPLLWVPSVLMWEWRALRLFARMHRELRP